MGLAAADQTTPAAGEELLPVSGIGASGVCRTCCLDIVARTSAQSAYVLGSTSIWFKPSLKAAENCHILCTRIMTLNMVG